MCYFGLWYWLNIQFNIINKQIYNYFPLAVCQRRAPAVGLLIMTFWTTRLVKYEKPDAGVPQSRHPALVPARVGHCLTVVSFAAVAVSRTHTIKTLEPVFSAAGFPGERHRLRAPGTPALLPIIGGVALASATELSFSWLGFSTAMASNGAFPRAPSLEEAQARMSPLNLYNFVTIVSLLFCIPFVVMFEGPRSRASKSHRDQGPEGVHDRAVEGWRVLPPVQPGGVPSAGKVELVTHAVGNVEAHLRHRVHHLAFGNKIRAQTAIGSGIAVVGAGPTAGSRRSTRTDQDAQAD